jgi:hypothetical protein
MGVGVTTSVFRNGDKSEKTPRFPPPVANACSADTAAAAASAAAAAAAAAEARMIETESSGKRIPHKQKQKHD